MFTWIGVPVVIFGALGLLTALLIEGRLNQQTFAIACVIVMVLAVVIWTVLLKRSNQPAGSSSPPNASKKKGLQVALLLLFLALAFWMTRGGPWIPRLIGASVLVLFITGTVLRKASVEVRGRSFVGGYFHDSNASSFGAFASGGAAGYFGPAYAGTPSQQGQPFAFGAYGGQVLPCGSRMHIQRNS